LRLSSSNSSNASCKHGSSRSSSGQSWQDRRHAAAAMVNPGGLLSTAIGLACALMSGQQQQQQQCLQLSSDAQLRLVANCHIIFSASSDSARGWVQPPAATRGARCLWHLPPPAYPADVWRLLYAGDC
jgi:hypothetical protein